jgi:hypothetical protein
MLVAVWLFIVALVQAQAIGPRPAVVKKICATSFGQGEMARVDVLLDRAKAVKVLALRPDITRYSHAPHTYFGPDGTTLLVVPERPITPEQAKSDPVLLQQQALLRDLTPGRPVYCKDHR